MPTGKVVFRPRPFSRTFEQLHLEGGVGRQGGVQMSEGDRKGGSRHVEQRRPGPRTSEAAPSKGQRSQVGLYEEGVGGRPTGEGEHGAGAVQADKGAA